MKKTELFNYFVDAIRETHEVRSYSGRNMYGKECLSFTFSRHESEAGMTAQIMADLADALPYEDLCSLFDVADLFAASKTDNFGVDNIIYFPNIKWDSGWNDDQDEIEEDEN